jgi:hypothetical protein
MSQTLAEEIEAAAEGEPILSVVIGKYDDREIPTELLNRPLTWEKARPLLDYEYDHGYGGNDCHPIYAWTASWIIFIHECDGSTDVGAFPRNPVVCEPGFG